MNKDTSIDISRESYYTSLFQSNFDVNVVHSLFEFYLYKMASSVDSPLSLKLDDSLSCEQKDFLFNQLLIDADINEADILFSQILRNEIKTIRIMGLSDTTLRCDRIKGFFHQKRSKDNKVQHKLDSMFNHIRNSFAHGRISITSEFLILEDKYNELTSRFVVTFDVLQKWKCRTESLLCKNN